MAGCIDVRVRLLDGSVGADPIADALGMARAFVVARAIGYPYRARRVAQEREVEVELLGERSILLSSIEADTENLDVLVGVLLNLVAEPATFARSSGGIGLGVEPNNDVLALEVGEPNGVPHVILQFE